MGVCKQGGVPLVNKVNFSEGDIKADHTLWDLEGSGGTAGTARAAVGGSGETGREGRTGKDRARGRWRPKSRRKSFTPFWHSPRFWFTTGKSSNYRRGRPRKRPLTHGRGGAAGQIDNSSKRGSSEREPCPAPPARLGSARCRHSGKGNTKAADRPCRSLLTLPRCGTPGALWPELPRLPVLLTAGLFLFYQLQQREKCLERGLKGHQLKQLGQSQLGLSLNPCREQI